MENIAILVPTYNSSIYIKEFLQSTTDVIKEVEDCKFSFLFVDDGSTDDTVLELQKAKESIPNITIVVFTKNYGQTQALLAGLKHIEADAYIIMSVDMQESPLLIVDFIKYWRLGYKACIAYRKYRSDNFLSRLLSKVFYTLVRIDMPLVPKGGFDYGLMDRVIAVELLSKPTNFRWLQGDIIDLGYAPKYFPCERVRPRLASNKLNISRFKFNYFFDGLVNVVRLPFKIIFLFSALLSVCLMLVLFFLLGKVLLLGINLPVEQIKNIGVAFAFSCLLLLLSFIIEFSYRIFELLTNKKDYVVKEIIK